MRYCSLIIRLPRSTQAVSDRGSAADRGVDHQGKCLAGEVVDDGEDAEASAALEGVGEAVEAPALFGRPARSSCPRPRGAAAARSHGQPLLGAEPVEPLPVHVDAFSFEEDAEAP